MPNPIIVCAHPAEAECTLELKCEVHGLRERVASETADWTAFRATVTNMVAEIERGPVSTPYREGRLDALNVVVRMLDCMLAEADAYLSGKQNEERTCRNCGTKLYYGSTAYKTGFCGECAWKYATNQSLSRLGESESET